MTTPHTLPVVAALWAARFAPAFAALRRGKQRSGYKLLCEIFSPSRRLRTAIVPSDVAAQPFLLRDAQRLRLASPRDVRAVFVVLRTGTCAGSSAGARRCFALLVLRTDP